MALTRGYLVDQSRGDLLPFPVLSSSTFKEGDMVYFDSSGRLEQLVAVSTAWTTEIFAGVATSNALNDQGVVYPSMDVVVWDTNIRMLLPLYSATPASAVFNPNMIGNKYGLYNSSTGFPCVNLDDTTNVKVRVVGVDAVDYPGWPTYNGAGTTQFPKLLVVPLVAACFLSGGR